MVDYEGRTRLSPLAAYHYGAVGGTHFLASTELDTMSALDTRISLEAFKRNPTQPSELT